MRKDKPTTICGDCKRSAGQCSWSAKFVPVEGWEAIPTKISVGSSYDDSYAVLSCPEFVDDTRYKQEYKYTFRKNAEEKVCVGKEETEAFIGTHISKVNMAIRIGNKIKGYDVEKCLV